MAVAGRWGPARALLPRGLSAALTGALSLELLSLLLGGGRPPRPGHLPPLLFLLGNVLGNAAALVRVSPSTRGVMLAAGAGRGWDYCYSCQSHVPPRCFHCHACNVCVLRRDHHCLLLGQCVGYQNYRYFLCLLLHGWAALLYASLLNADVFMSLLREGVTLHSVLLLFVPWVMLLTGQVSAVTFAYAFMADVCVVGFLFCSGFLLFHSLLTLRGQTTKEWFGESHQYDLGWHCNLREALGERWHLVWLSPLITSPLPGDGVTFQSKAPQAELPFRPSNF